MAAPPGDQKLGGVLRKTISGLTGTRTGVEASVLADDPGSVASSSTAGVTGVDSRVLGTNSDAAALRGVGAEEQ